MLFSRVTILKLTSHLIADQIQRVDAPKPNYSREPGTLLLREQDKGCLI